MLFANQISIGGKGSKIPVGIHARCKVTSVEVGDRFIDFNYEDSEGRVNNKRVWFPDITKITPKDGENIQEALKRRETEDLAHIVKHMHIFLTPEEFNTFSAPDFVSFCKKAETLLTPKLTTKMVNLKLIFDANGYSTFGRYPDYIQEYVEGQDPTLTYTKYELENKVKPPKLPEADTPSGDNSILY